MVKVKAEKKEKLKYQYVEQSLPKTTIAKNLNIRRETVRYWVNKMKLRRKYKDPKFLKKKRLKEQKSAGEIAKGCNVCRSTINNWLHKFDIPTKMMGSKPKSQEKFEQEVLDLVGKEYVVLGDYIRSDKKIKFRHEKCSNIFKMKPANFLIGQRCPICNESSGERKIRQWLVKQKIPFAREYTFSECKDQYVLPFDFVIFYEKDALRLLIEYQGIQHFQSIESWGGQEQLEYRKRHDKIKKSYCRENRIDLLEIKYTEKQDIPTILNKRLLK